MVRLLIDCMSSRRERKWKIETNPWQLLLYILMFVHDGLKRM